MDEIVKIQRGQFVVDQFPQGLVPAFLHKLAVQRLRNAEIHQIDRNLDFVGFILRGGVGDANVRHIGEVNIPLLVFLLTEVPNQLYGFIQFIGIDIALGFRRLRLTSGGG